MAEQTDYANLKVTEEDHAQIDAAIHEIMESASRDSGLGSDSDLLNRNPANPSEIVAHFPQAHADASHVESLFVGAADAQRAWGRLRSPTRIAVMREFAGNVGARLYRFIAAMILEAGKSRAEAKAEACEAVALIRYYCDRYEAAHGYCVEMAMSAGALCCDTVSRPLGVFAVISPFNFPLALATGMCTGALLTGNAAVWKPSAECPLTAALLHHAYIDACARVRYCDASIEPIREYVSGIGKQAFGFVVCPDGAFERGMVQGRQHIAGFAFTGSKAVGFHLKRLLESHEPAPKIIAELGGKNYCIVTPRVRSLDAMGRGVARSAFGYAGQKCSACSVLLVHETMECDAIAAVVKATEEQFVLGDPRERDVTLGPLINDRAFARYQRVRKELAESGATVVVPSIRKKTRAAGGYYAEPIIVYGLPHSHRFFSEELFLPVLCVRTYSGLLSEAVKIANATEYGLTAGLFSDDHHEIEHFLGHMDAGVLYVNREAGATTGAWPGEQAFGGWKNSGIVTQFGVCGPDYLRNFVRGQSHTMYKGK